MGSTRMDSMDAVAAAAVWCPNMPHHHFVIIMLNDL